MADKYPGINPYVYCNDDPVNLVDPDGMDWEEINGVRTYVLPEVTVTPNGYYFSYSAENSYRAFIAPMPLPVTPVIAPPVGYTDVNQSIRTGRAIRFLANKLEELEQEIQIMILAIGVEIYSTFLNNEDGNQDANQGTIQEVDDTKPDPNKIYVDKAGNEYRFKPKRNWNGKKDRNGNFSSKDRTSWGPLQDHKGTHGIPHHDVQLPNGKHVNVTPKNT